MRRIGLLVWLLVAGCAEPPAAPVTQARTPASLRDSLYDLAANAANGLPDDSLVPLDILTYDGSGQITEPAIVHFPRPFTGWTYALVFNPYPGGDHAFENASVLYSNNLRYWTHMPGSRNPVATTDTATTMFNADPDGYYLDTDSSLVITWLSTYAWQWLNAASTHDGVRYGAPNASLYAAVDAVLSPTFVWRNGQLRMWSVNAGNCNSVGQATSVETRQLANGAWTGPVPVALSQSGYYPWHINVRYDDRIGYYATFAAYPRDSTCDATSLFFAASADGSSWRTFPNPVLSPADVAAYQQAVYQSGSYYDPSANRITFIFSGFRYVNGREDWGPYALSLDYDTLLARLSRGAAVSRGLAAH